jgi:hypothetical protein
MNYPQQIRKNYKIRNQRLSDALRDGATRINPTAPTRGGKCAICRRAELGGGLLVYRRRDGSELPVGERCADYMDYLIVHPHQAASLLR